METRIERFGRFTVAEVKEIIKINNVERKFTGVGLARLSDTDTYDKKRAEAIALGRAIKAVRKKEQGKRINNILMG